MNKLRALWWLLDICLLAAAIIAIGYAAVVGKVGDLLVSMAVTKHDSTSKLKQFFEAKLFLEPYHSNR